MTAPVVENVAASHPATPCIVYRGPLNANGYGYPRLVKGDHHGRLLHRWVVEQLEGVPLAPGEVVMHTCDTRACFRYEHLRRATQSANIQDAITKGRHRYIPHIGEANGSAVLTDEQVTALRGDSTAGVSRSDLAAKYNMSKSQIANIVSGRQWRHLL